jgi:hypothetical protein
MRTRVEFIHRGDIENSPDITVSSKSHDKMMIIAPEYAGGPVGIYYVEEDGSISEGGEFDAELFMDHIMSFYHKHY